MLKKGLLVKLFSPCVPARPRSMQVAREVEDLLSQAAYYHGHLLIGTDGGAKGFGVGQRV